MAFSFKKGPIFYSSLRSPATGRRNVQKLLTQNWVFIAVGRVFLACSDPPRLQLFADHRVVGITNCEKRATLLSHIRFGFAKLRLNTTSK